jgi:hypothetical protein
LPVAPPPPYEVSSYVSLHTDLLRYDVRTSDGTWVGDNPDQSVAPGGTKTYLLHADIEPGVVLLQDFADIRNHRHHGLIGALVVESREVTPLDVGAGETSAAAHPDAHAPRAWTGARATLWNQRTHERIEEMVLLLQDGVRYYVDGIENEDPEPNPPDVPGDFEEGGSHDDAEASQLVGADVGAGSHGGPDPEDQGHKAFNYRSERIDGAFPPNGPLANPSFTFPSPATPIVLVPARSEVILRFVCAADKPRNHGFTLHGHAWREWSHRGAESAVVSSEGALTCSSVRSYQFRANAQPGDYLYRNTVFKWHVAQGAWGILRVR